MGRRKTQGISGPDPERPGNNERLGRRGNFIARSRGRSMCAARLREVGAARERAERRTGSGGARFIEFSKYPCTRRCRTRRLHFSTPSIYLALFFFFIRALLFVLAALALPLRPSISTPAPSLRSSRRLFLVSARAPILFGNDSRFLNFAATWKQVLFRGGNLDL